MGLASLLVYSTLAKPAQQGGLVGTGIKKTELIKDLGTLRVVYDIGKRATVAKSTDHLYIGMKIGQM